MGGRLCSHVINLAVLGTLKGLSPSARIALDSMAAIARDEARKGLPAGLYFGGWELLAKAMGYEAYTPAAHRAVARATAELVARGLIDPVQERAGNGIRQAYLLTLPDALGKAPS
jgi:hypothetical protein